MSGKYKCAAVFLALALLMSLGCVGALADGEQTVLADDGQVTMTVTDYDGQGEYGPAFEVLLENKTDRALVFDLHDVAVDGVMCDPYWVETVPAGKKAYSSIGWYTEDLQTLGIHYIETVTGELTVYDDESYDDVFVGQVSWSGEQQGEGPAVEPLQFDHGFEPVEMLTGDAVLTAVDYDPAGSYDGGPALVFYMENHTDRKVYFTVEDVAVNGFVCDPYWGMTVAPGAVAYSQCSWWQDDLDQSHIDTVETVEFTARAEDDETFDEYGTADVELDLTGGGASVTAAEQPAAAEPVELDGEVAALMGAVEDNVYSNDYFGLTFAPAEGWTFATQQELLAQYDLAAERFDGTEIGEDVRAFMDSESGFSVMLAQAEGGLQNVNALVESLPGLGKYLSEGQLLDMVEHDLGLEEGGDMTAMGLEGAVLSRSTFSFAGAEHEALRVEYTDTSMGIEMPMYIQMVYIMGDDYVLQVTITTVFEDHTADVGAMFTLAQ